MEQNYFSYEKSGNEFRFENDKFFNLETLQTDIKECEQDNYFINISLDKETEYVSIKDLMELNEEE